MRGKEASTCRMVALRSRLTGSARNGQLGAEAESLLPKTGQPVLSRLSGPPRPRTSKQHTALHDPSQLCLLGTPDSQPPAAHPPSAPTESPERSQAQDKRRQRTRRGSRGHGDAGPRAGWGGRAGSTPGGPRRLGPSGRAGGAGPRAGPGPRPAAPRRLGPPHAATHRRWR